VQVVTFQAAGGTHGIPILAVEEFFRPVPITPVPLADRRVAGLMNLRGKSCTVIDLKACFDRPAPAQLPVVTPKMILLETNDRLTDEAKQLGVKTFAEPVVLMVDRIVDIVAVNVADIQPRPAHVRERFVAGVFRLHSEFLSFLDLQPMLDDILAGAD
jgi:purine-binding chemotaxis protein CheW